MKLERLILKQAEKKLRPYRLEANSFKQEHSGYKSYLPHIQKCVERATYWHGTGRYHYQYQVESRYESVSADGLLDVLDSIVQHDGLTPHQDPWIASGGKTVSLGTVRMHSRLFARIHQYEKNSLLYELGSAGYWTQFYLILLLLWVCTNLESGRQLGKIFSRRSWYKDMQTWGSAIRDPRNGKMRIWDVVTSNVTGSDIETNYPLLIGVAKGTLEVIETLPLTHAVEVRSLQPVTLKDFTHIEVPLAKVKETEEFLRAKSIQFKVLPIEYVDVYMSQIPLKELAYS